MSVFYSTCCFTNLINEFGTLDVRELGVGSLQVSVTFGLNQTLVWSLSRGSSLSISSIELIDDVHAFNDLSERRKALLVKETVPLVSCIDKDL